MPFYTPIIIVLILFVAPFFSTASAVEVGITDDIASLEVNHLGQSITIQRIQDTENRLTGGFTKTSRPCPPFCIGPMQIAEGVITVGELEVLAFLDNDVANGTGILIDARMPDWYKRGAIPGAINIPFVVFDVSNPYATQLLATLGASEENGRWNFDRALKLLMYCNGPWCDQSRRAIDHLLASGYPAEKILYYRGGMHLWQALGLTTVIGEIDDLDNSQ